MQQRPPNLLEQRLQQQQQQQQQGPMMIQRGPMQMQGHQVMQVCYRYFSFDTIVTFACDDHI